MADDVWPSRPAACKAVRGVLSARAVRFAWLADYIRDSFQSGPGLDQPLQNNFALFAARHLGAKEFEDERIGRLANSPDRYLGSLRLKARQAPAIDELFRVFAYGRAAKLSNSFTRQAQNDLKSRRIRAPLDEASSLIWQRSEMV